MPLLVSVIATNPCSDGETVCNTIFRLTGNESFADWSHRVDEEALR